MSLVTLNTLATALGALGDLTDDAYLLVDAGGRVQAASGCFAAAARRQVSAGMHLADLLGGDGRERAEVLRAVACGARAEIVFPRCPFSGRSGEFRLRIFPLQGEEGPAGSLLKLEEAEAVSPQVLAAWRQVAAGAAHEIRNPLAGVRGFLQLLGKRLQGDEERRYLAIILKEIDRVTELTRELMALFRPVEARNEKASSETVVWEAVEAVRPRAQAQGVLVEVLAAKGCCQGDDFDRERLGTILTNLLGNALDAMPTGGRLTVTCRIDRSAAWCQIDVSDTGPGIPAEHLPYIFEPYYTTKPSGTGLGLFICRRLAEEMGGSISVESRPEAGTVFRLRLPVPSSCERSHVHSA